MQQAIYDLSRWNEFFQLVSWVVTPLWVQQIETFHHLLRLRLISIDGGKECTQEKTQWIVLAGVLICISRCGCKIALQVCGKKQIRVHPNRLLHAVGRGFFQHCYTPVVLSNCDQPYPIDDANARVEWVQ